MQKQIFLFFLVFLFFQNVGQGQNVYLYSQADVDAFDTSITTIDGNLSIRNDVHDLSNLSNITSINGDFSSLYVDSLINLTGLENLTSVGGGFYITENESLESLANLESLAYVGGSFILKNNALLVNLEGLENLDSIGQSLTIEENELLQNMTGLNNLRSTGHLEITDNISLKSLAGLESLTYVNENVIIKFNDSLENLIGLENLDFVGQNFTLSRNESLQNLTGLNDLTSVGGIFDIRVNESLQVLTGLNNLTSVGVDFLIEHNDSLENLIGLENLDFVGQNFTIKENEMLLNLTGLNSFSSMIGRLSIAKNNSLQNLVGLENLISVGGDFQIWDNESLQNLTGLNNLFSIGGGFYITENESIISLVGLENLASIDSIFNIVNNASLVSLNGLDNLSTVGIDFRINRNHFLQNLTGLENLASVGGILVISENDRLENLAGLEKLTSVGNDLSVGINESLQNLTGLENLASVGDDLFITHNYLLESLQGLENLYFIGNKLTISNNDNLKTCTTTALCIYLNLNNDNVFISDNDSGCNSPDEVISYCEPLPSAQGCMYWDENQNGIRDLEEKNIISIKSIVYPDDLFSFPDTSGCFTHFLNDGNYILSYLQSPLWQLNSDSAEYHITVTDDFYINLDFGFIPTDTIIAGNLHVAAGIPRCFREVEFDFNFRNEGTTILNGILWGQVWDEWMEVANYIQAPDTIDEAANGVRMGWFYEDLYPGELLQKTVILEMPEIEEEGFELGDFYLVTSTVIANGHTGGVDYFNYRLREEIVCAYDPNDKLVSPDREGVENYTLFDEDLFYTIRFQNTGNDTAFTVVVRDTLDENLDVSSFRLLASSHQNILRTEILESQFVTFTFDDIMLPDSNVNFNGSQGYVTYVIQENEGLDENTIIDNTASIYFDFNPPIVTNTTENTMVSCLPIEETIVEATINTGEIYTLPDGETVSEAGTYTTEVLDEEGCAIEIIITNLDVLSSTSNLAWNDLVSISPNPSNDHFILDIQHPEIIAHQLVLSNIYGQTVFTKHLHESQTKIDVKPLVSGIYWVQLRNQNNELVAVQKLVVAR